MRCRVCRIVVMLLTLTFASASAARRPNIVLIVADDMGFSDVGCFGGEIATPNIDRLAATGVRFTQFYNNARCCPTRASLMTGMYPHQVGVGAMNQDLGPAAYRGDLSDRCVTLAEALRGAGYRTGMVGKWHLSNLTVSPTAPNKAVLNFEAAGAISESMKSWPCNRGFEEHFGTIAGVGNFFDPWSLVHNQTPITPAKGFYYTDFINDHACDLIDQFSRAGEDKPFFLYVAHTAPHWPLHAKPADIAKYADTYRDGWDAMRQRRHQRLIELGIIDRHLALSAREGQAWDDASHQDWEARRMAVYAAQVDCMDQGIGRILNKLDQHKLAGDTLVLFMSDNGGCAENVQPNWYDIPSKTRNGRAIRIGNDPSMMPGDDTTFQSYGPSWANLSNTPFRRFKHFIEEGGIATPLIVRWPARLRSRDGQLERQPGHVIDIMPTCLDAAGVAPPSQLEGTSLFAGNRPPTRMFWEHEGARGVRVGDFKLVAARGEPWHLYDLAADRTELNDLAGLSPDKVAQLQKLYDDWARRCGVQSWPIR